jgi:hypothetical protein
VFCLLLACPLTLTIEETEVEGVQGTDLASGIFSHGKKEKRDEKVKEMRIIKKVAGGVFSREKKGR